MTEFDFNFTLFTSIKNVLARFCESNGWIERMVHTHTHRTLVRQKDTRETGGLLLGVHLTVDVDIPFHSTRQSSHTPFYDCSRFTTFTENELKISNFAHTTESQSHRPRSSQFCCTNQIICFYESMTFAITELTNECRENGSNGRWHQRLWLLLLLLLLGVHNGNKTQNCEQKSIRLGNRRALFGLSTRQTGRLSATTLI